MVFHTPSPLTLSLDEKSKWERSFQSGKGEISKQDEME